jgi:hypothetical protein
MARIFEAGPLMILVVAAVVAFIIGLGTSGARNDPDRLGGAIEAAVLTLLGGFLARALISALLAAGNDSPGTGLALGWAFFLVPGIVDTIAGLFGTHPLTSPGTLLAIAAGVGAFTGMMSGLYRIYSLPFGPFQFLSDVTWGLSGTTTAGLLHLWNVPFGTHAPLASDSRKGVHRYERGFHMPGHSAFAFTQGSVMSNLSHPPGSPLYRHERTHVLQSRLFGPLFTLSYVGWMALLAIPALVRGLAASAPGAALESWCYFSNPWEVWGYFCQRRAGGGDARVSLGGRLIWSEGAVIAASVPYFAAANIAMVLVAMSIW